MGEAESTRYLAMFLANAPAVLFALDRELRYTLSAGAGLAALGLKPGEVVGVSLYEYVGSDDPEHPIVAEALRALAGEPKVAELAFADRTYLVYHEPLRDAGGEIQGVAGLSLDITELKRAEAEARRNRERLELAHAAGGLGVFDWDLVTGELVWSEQLEELYGLPAGSFERTVEDFHRRIHPDDLARVQELNRRTLAGGEEWEIEYRIVLPDGTVRWLGERGRPFLGRTGTPVSVVGVDLDITERRRAEEDLRASEGRFRALIENSKDAIVIVDASVRVQYASPSHEPMLGYRPEELVGTSALDLIHPDDRPLVEAEFARGLATPGAMRSVEYRVRDASGAWHMIEGVGVNLLDDPAVGGVLITSRDVTERKLLEARLAQAERLEAIGQLAGGVAHDFNNLLMVVGANAAALQSRLKGSEHAHRVDEIVNASERATELTRRLLAFGRRQEAQPQALAIGEVVTRLEPLLRRTIPADVELAIELERGVAPVLADPSQLEQVLVNLVVNSRDAMPTGGTITIAVRTSTLTHADQATSPPIGPGSYVTLSVSDTGAGIDPATLPHIFEPFFTTKGEGLGTGLGLATVHGIATQCGGGTRVDSRPGAGTTVAVFLPAARPGVDGEG